MTGVIAIGHRAGPFLDQPAHAVHLDLDVLEDLPALHDAVAAQLREAGAVVVVHPAAVEPAARRALGTVRAALGGAPVLRHATGLPPLAADVLVTLAAALDGPLGGAVAVAAALPAIEAQVLGLAWLPSVKGLRHPAPTVAQHAASAVPGRSWLVRTWPEPAVERLRSAQPPALPAATESVGVALADADGDRSWIGPATAALADAVGVEVEPSPDAAAHWGSRRSTEIAVYPRDVLRLAGALWRDLDPGRCAWCRRDVVTHVCPWCALPRDGLLRPPAAGEPAVGASAAGGAAGVRT